MLEFKLNAEQSELPGALDLLNEHALKGGKGFRPKILRAVAACLGLKSDRVDAFAIAAERFHSATLLHDDVIDDAVTRRGRPTLNAQGENKRAILGGDLLLAETLRDLGKTGQWIVLQDLLDVLVELTEGEWLQLESRHNADVDRRHLLEVARKKTGSVIGWCFAAPARISSLWELALPLRLVGQSVGLVFQILDDVLDFDPSSSGKPYCQDLREGQINFVTVELLDLQPQLKTSIFDANRILELAQTPSKQVRHAVQNTLDFAERELCAVKVALEALSTKHPPLHSLQAQVAHAFEDRIASFRRRLL